MSLVRIAFQHLSMHAQLHRAECIESKGNPLLVFVVDFTQYVLQCLRN